MNEQIRTTSQTCLRAWSLEFGSSAVRLLRLSRSEGSWQVDQVQVHVLADRWRAAPNWSAAVEHFTTPPADEPLAVCLSDELVLYRQMILPAVEREVLERMVSAQVAVTLPGAADAFAWSWLPLSRQAGLVPARSGGGEQPVLLAAVRRDVLEQLLAAARRLGEPAMVMPATVAFATGVQAFTHLPSEPCLVIHVSDRHASLLAMQDGCLQACGVSEEGTESWTEAVAQCVGFEIDAAASFVQQQLAGTPQTDDQQAKATQAMERSVLRWARRLGETYRGLTATLSESLRPTAVVVTGTPSATSPMVMQTLESILRLPVRQLKIGQWVAGLQGVNGLEHLGAAGAGRTLIDPDAPRLSLVAPAGLTHGERRRVPWALIAAGLWIVLALVTMYQLDQREATRLTALIEERRPTSDVLQAQDQALSLGRYLEQTGLPPLAVLTAIAAVVPDAMVLNAWQYERQGTTRFSGVVGDADALDTVLKALAESPLLQAVRPGPSSFDNQQRTWRFEIGARVQPVSHYLLHLDRQRALANAEPSSDTVADVTERSQQ